MSAVIAFKWDGERDVMAPLPRFLKECRAEFADEETYILATQEPRSGNSHRHFFASIQSAWANLPESIGKQFPTSEHLRKRALIEAGFHDCHSVVLSSHAEALRVAAFMEPLDEYGVIIVKAATVTRYTAKSQSMKAMGKVDFQRSKEAVLDFVAGLVGTSIQSLKDSAV